VLAEVRYRRAPGRPWRWWRGRVLVMSPEAHASELAGAVAVLCVTLDAPSTRADLEAAVAGSPVEDALAPLLQAGLVEEIR
jgi:hypothetical protein